MQRLLVLGAAALVAGALTTSAPTTAAATTTITPHDRPCYIPTMPHPSLQARRTLILNVWGGSMICSF